MIYQSINQSIFISGMSP